MSNPFVCGPEWAWTVWIKTMVQCSCFFFSIVNSTCAPYIPLFHCRKPGSKDSEVNHNPTIYIYIHIHNNPCIHQKITDPNAHGFRFPMFFPCFFPFLEPIMFPSFSHDFYSFPEARCVARNDWVPSLWVHRASRRVPKKLGLFGNYY